MISFVIIGHNEGWKLSKCFESVFNTIKHNELREFEIVYVDSQSTDDSIKRAKAFDKIKIFKITGKYNAAIARNIGAVESKGDVLFFIDGDMEIQSDFLSLVYNKIDGLLYDFVSGQFNNNYYDNNGNYLFSENYFSLKKDQYQTTTGGLFLIKKNIWESVNGMRTKYKKSQDLDIGLRLSKIGIKLLRKKELLAKHYTISYNDSSRMWKMFFKGSELYRVVLFRDHYRCSVMLRNYFRINYTSILLLLSLLTTVFFNSLFPMITYFGIIFLRACINMKKSILNVPSRFIYFIFRDISLWFALLFFWPKEVKTIKYQKII